MKPEQKSEETQNRLRRRGNIVGGSPRGHDAYQSRLILVTALLVASIGINFCLIRLPHRAQSVVRTAPAARTKTSPPGATASSYDPWELKVVRMPRYEYWFRWQRGNRVKGEWGDVLSVYSVHDYLGRTPVYRQILEGTFVSEILPWTVPGAVREGPNAFMVVSNFATGSSLRYTIYAEIHGHIRTVLDVFNGHAWYRYPLEVVDLDGDGPEIISIDDYRRIGKTDQTARVWKWSPAQSRYVQVRVSSYADRLKPLPVTQNGAF